MKQLVLIGAGHAHAQVLLGWARAPLPGVALTVVSPQALAPYSGMVPGWLAGVYRFDQIVIDFQGLARAAGARWVAAGVEIKLGLAGDAATLAGAGLVLWATGAQAHDWQRDAARRGGLAASDDGFIDIDETLRSRSHPTVFAVGDGAHWARGPALPKAGVYAVRQGPVLLHNLRAALSGGTLQAYEPQRRFLALLATADGSAIATRGPFGAHGRWAWWWKDRIDRGFIGRFPRTPTN
jgi:NADH dehydrogenase FAD-containing subunit